MQNLDKIIEQLKTVAVKVSTEDRMEAALECGCHLETINRYLRGEVSKEPMALQLLAFLKKKISNREKALA